MSGNKSFRRSPNALTCRSESHPDNAPRGEASLTVDGAQQMLRVEGRRRLHAHVRCTCGHEWWSRHPRALELSREADAMALAGGVKGAA